MEPRRVLWGADGVTAGGRTNGSIGGGPTLVRTPARRPRRGIGHSKKVVNSSAHLAAWGERARLRVRGHATPASDSVTEGGSKHPDRSEPHAR